MKATMHVSNPNSVEFTLEITMPLGHWKSLRDALGSDDFGASYQIKSAIRDMVYQAQESFAPDIIEAGEGDAHKKTE